MKWKDVSWGEDTSSIILDDKYYFGLKGLEDFSHVIIIYHLDKAKYEKDKHLQRRPQNRDDIPIITERLKKILAKGKLTNTEFVKVTSIKK